MGASISSFLWPSNANRPCSGSSPHEHPNAGKRLLPVTIDEIANESPQRVCMSIPKTYDLADGCEDISFSRLANAINRMAWFIEANIGISKKFETFAYIGKSDIRYIVVAMAAAKTGWKALFTSHMNSLAGHLSLLDYCSCKILLSASGVEVADILKAWPMRNVLIPSLDDTLDLQKAPHYTFEKTWEESKLEPFVVLHSSGTTGLPKPVTVNHAVPAAVDAQSIVDTSPSDASGYKRMHRAGYFKGRLLVPFAPFHFIVCNEILALAVFAETVIVFPARDGLAGTETIAQAIDYGYAEKAFLPPSVLVELSKSERGLDSLAKMKYLFCGGGILPPQAGNLISSRTHLINMFGSTETGPLILGERDPNDWEYLSFDPDYNGLEWRFAFTLVNEGRSSQPVELYEPIIIRRPALESFQAIFLIRPELTEWTINDLYTKHPSKPHTWKFAGRRDDLICFCTGQKYHPMHTEARISSHPLILSGLMFGDQHEQPLLLVELRNNSIFNETGKVPDDIEAEIWKFVDESNVDAPTVAYIARTHILFAKPDKLFLRASKGTVQRKLTIEMYTSEIEECYQRYGDVSAPMLGRTGDLHH